MFEITIFSIFNIYKLLRISYTVYFYKLLLNIYVTKDCNIIFFLQAPIWLLFDVLQLNKWEN